MLRQCASSLKFPDAESVPAIPQGTTTIHRNARFSLWTGAITGCNRRASHNASADVVGISMGGSTNSRVW